MDPNFYIETPRLIISHFNSALGSHCDLLINLTNDPNVHIENGSIGVLTPDRESARQDIDLNKVKDSTGYGRYIVSLKTPGTRSSTTKSNPTSPHLLETYPKIGNISMKVRKFPGAPKLPDLGFTFLTPYTGKGYATEAAEALTRYFQGKGHSQFLGYCHPENENSKKMFRRMGWKDFGTRELRGLASSLGDRSVRGWVFGLGIEEGDLEGIGVMP